jgi:tRNA-dihydrouridine synthase 1
MSMSQKPKHISWPHQHVVGPMVNASDIPFRLLCRKYGADVCYTQMWKSWLMDAKNPDACAYTARVMAEFEAGAADRPLIIQFAGRDVPSLLHAARTVQDHVDAGTDMCVCV